METNEFAGKTAVVTGGSEGLGKDFCRELTQRGCTVFFCARDTKRGLAVEAELGSLAHFIAADLAEPSRIEQFAEQVREHSSGVDYLVNNVALDDRLGFEEVTPELCDHMWRINTRSCLLTTRAFLDLVRAGSGKAILNIGTTNYMIGFESFSLYSATKSALLGFTRSLARELGKEGIRVNMLSPGWIMTDKQLKQYVTPRDQEELLRDQSLKFLLEPGDVTPAALFLLSSAGRGIAGQNLIVDGGKLMI